jgi:hypothetical protein
MKPIIGGQSAVSGNMKLIILRPISRWNTEIDNVVSIKGSGNMKLILLINQQVGNMKLD